MPDLSDRVAIVALVVSSVAFVVGAIQLILVFNRAADGFRRCAEPVIGPWSRLRWRVVSVFDFRNEIVFVTPHFRVVSEPMILPPDAVMMTTERMGSDDALTRKVKWALQQTLQESSDRQTRDTEVVGGILGATGAVSRRPPDSEKAMRSMTLDCHDLSLENLLVAEPL